MESFGFFFDGFVVLNLWIDFVLIDLLVLFVCFDNVVDSDYVDNSGFNIVWILVFGGICVWF